jgi:hypothetical protein
MFYRTYGYSYLIQMAYRYHSTIKIQRWWRSILQKRKVIVEMNNEYVLR